MQMVLISAVLASPLSTCRGTRGSIAVSQLPFLRRTCELQQRKSLVMVLQVDEKTGEHNLKCLWKTTKIVLVDDKPFY